jgi:hypothetical protein
MPSGLGIKSWRIGCLDTSTWSAHRTSATLKTKTPTLSSGPPAHGGTLARSKNPAQPLMIEIIGAINTKAAMLQMNLMERLIPLAPVIRNVVTGAVW